VRKKRKEGLFHKKNFENVEKCDTFYVKISSMNENEIAQQVVDCCFNIHKKLGPGLFESVYEEIMDYELRKTGFLIERQKPIPVYWDGLKLDMGFRADFIIENKVIIEVKSIATIAHVHQKQVLTYLKLTNIKLGLLINYNEGLIKNGLKRIVNGL
jgi:GxxExxY protein